MLIGYYQSSYFLHSQTFEDLNVGGKSFLVNDEASFR